jgi:hypothetical protein
MAAVTGRGTSLNMSGDHNTVYAKLLVNANTAYGHMAYGSYDAETRAGVLTTDNTLSFDMLQLATETLEVNIDGNQRSAVVKDQTTVKDGITFADFQKMIGSSLGGTFNIANCVDLSMLTLTGVENFVNLRNVGNLSIEANGVASIVIFEDKVENLTSLSRFNTVKLSSDATALSSVVLNANTISSIELSSKTDQVIFNDNAKFGQIILGEGNHTVVFNGLNGSPTGSELAGVIRLGAVSASSSHIREMAARSLSDEVVI